MAILRLKTVPSECVIPICLPSEWTDDLIMNDFNLTMASFNGGYHEKSIPVIDGKACYDKYHKNRASLKLTKCDEKIEGKGKTKSTSFKEEKNVDKLSFNYLCSDEHMTKSGDSGSPLMRKNDENVWTLIAIVRGFYYWKNFCTNGTPLKYGDYQTIFPRLSWVRETVKK